MSYLKRLYLLTFIAALANTAYANEDDNVYTWRATNGTVVFSQTAPIFDQEYQRIGVYHKNQIEQKIPVEQQLTYLKHNDLYLDNENLQAITIQATNQSETVKVKIISPANGESRFVHNEKLTIILEPTLTAEDHPIFIINGIPNPAHFENGIWKVNRPNPGPVTIAVRGRTKDHKIINSDDSEFYRRQVLGR
ncbi:DUF4124 domain-containing protein [Francisella tularensis subsp. novicida]|uniref:DUF4124 domain-containing protein n=1 Tax=Francisella tularensis TaxID=263 RepID=UPI000158AF0E|nr:DUF4124 domain-containing protein [Francisella tularensis]AJI45351.1 hypothetical protein AS84_986 [Francisella tularensis subsp. novicida F6168]AJJ48135.1 hypothetical protein CH70_409 [Francisella tularensis subsp. novicida]APC98569.1 hypothetical protein KX03_1568 [Francisella tularensis subsp. novicida]EDN36817.1 conserved hypothetical protein [Francisella tularensis subsp. novicida GA99-3549]KFJ67085.1 hypothetical protein DR83_1830 [Francisella tularensis subsp. novicida]